MLTPHPAYLALGSAAAMRASAYQALLADALPDDQVVEIRAYLQQQLALGRDSFRAMVEARTARFAGIRQAHRPRRQTGLAD